MLLIGWEHLIKTQSMRIIIQTMIDNDWWKFIRQTVYLYDKSGPKNESGFVDKAETSMFVFLFLYLQKDCLDKILTRHIFTGYRNVK